MKPIFKGTAAMADRMVRAENDFIETVMRLGEIGRDEAERVLAYYRRHKLIKSDAVIGRIDVKDGGLLDREVIQNAVSVTALLSEK